MTVRAGIGVLTVLLSACGARVAPGDLVMPADAKLAAAESPSAEGTVGATDAASQAEADSGAVEAARGGETFETPMGEPRLTHEEVVRRHNNGYVRISLSASCVAPLSPLTITIRGGRFAGVTALISFSDEETHGNLVVGNADGRGEYVWQVVIPLDAPPGTAQVFVSMTGPDWGPGGATADKPFRVAKNIEECG